MQLRPKTIPAVTTTPSSTAVPLSTSQVMFNSAFIEADESNVGNVYLGSSETSLTNGITLAPGAGCSIDNDKATRIRTKRRVYCSRPHRCFRSSRNSQPFS